MKRVKLLLIVLSIAVIIPATGFAFIDIGANIGYNRNTDVYSFNNNGMDYGFNIHLNSEWKLAGFGLTFGFGPSFQFSNYFVGDDYSYDKKNIGLETYAQVDILFLHPYIKFGTDIYESIGGTSVPIEGGVFQTFQFGGGLGFSVLPLVIADLQLYIEYMQSKVWSGTYNDGTSHAYRFGVRAFIL